MARILILTQGALAEELARGARTITGKADRLATLSLDWNESLESSERKVGETLARLEDDEVLILTDLPGGTPFNVARGFAREGHVEVVSGVNLSMVVRLCCPGSDERSLDELATWIQEKGRQSICRSGECATGSEARCG